MTQDSKNKLESLRKIFFREKFRFDHGSAYLVFINFALLVTSLVTQVGGNRGHVKYFVFGGLFFIWVLGYFLDRIVQVQAIQEKVALKRSYIWQENFSHHDKQQSKLHELSNRLKNIEEKLDE